MKATPKQKIKITRRVLVYGDGKVPGKDEPDQIIEAGERVRELTGREIRENRSWKWD